MIDTDLVVRKMNLISADLKEILRLSHMSADEFLKDRYAGVLAERFLERLIGRMIDINFHVITETGNPPPRDYYESFLNLGTLGILPVELAKQMAGCTGLRNRIAHEYNDLDSSKVHEALGAAARDIPVYLQRIHSHISTQK